MTKLSDREIDLMDKLLVLKRDFKNYFLSDIAKSKLGIDNQELQFLVDKIIDFNDIYEKIVHPMDKGQNFQSFELCFETTRFIDNGGFKHFFNKQNPANTGFSSNIIGDNFSHNTIIIGDNAVNQPNSQIDNSEKSSISQTINLSENEGKQNKFISILLKYWWAYVIPTLVGLTILAIEYKWFVKK